MLRAFTCVVWVSLLTTTAPGQTEGSSPKFEIANVRSSPKLRNAGLRNAAPRGGRYEIKQATMLDLVRIAYGSTNDKILGGPSWLELDRFDVIAKLSEDTTPNDRRQMLQALLTERFKLTVHKDTRPVPVYALTVGKKSLMKEADGEGESGCKPETAAGAPAEGGIRLKVRLVVRGSARTQLEVLGFALEVANALLNCRISSRAAQHSLGGNLEHVQYQESVGV